MDDSERLCDAAWKRSAAIARILADMKDDVAPDEYIGVCMTSCLMTALEFADAITEGGISPEIKTNIIGRMIDMLREPHDMAVRRN